MLECACNTLRCFIGANLLNRTHRKLSFSGSSVFLHSNHSRLIDVRRNIRRLHRVSDINTFANMPVGVLTRTFQGVTPSFYSSKIWFMVSPCRNFSLRNKSSRRHHFFRTCHSSQRVISITYKITH